ncbi:MAG: SEL1-like repeat protein, partial [Pirellulaceae bacterium]
NNLAISYDEGTGVPQDHQEAYIWISLAYANDGGDELYKKNLAIIKAKLSPEQLAEAQSRATELSKRIEERQ